MVANIISITAAVIGTLGFCFVLRVRQNRLPVIIASTAICYGIYIFASYVTGLNNLSIFIASTSAAAICEILARIIKAPVTVLLIPTILPLIPGASLYYTIDALFRSEMQSSMDYLATTGKAIGAILLGIMTVTTITKIVTNHRRWKNNDPTLKYRGGVHLKNQD